MLSNCAVLCVLAVTMAITPALSAQTEQTLYNFAGTTDGRNPLSSLIMDSFGNLFGTTFVGGSYGAGEVFELSPSGAGQWTESVIYSFTGGSDGAYPYYADVTLDATGNLYGTTVQGGLDNLGTVFELSPSANGWHETVLYSFSGGLDGANPYAGLVMDSAGNLFGTTFGGGANGIGTVFELALGSNGQWTEQLLHTFNGESGNSPVGGLVIHKGSLYGVTQGGGDHGYGVVYKVAATDSVWREKVLYSFTGGNDGGLPCAERLVFDHSGHLYGTTEGGGNFQRGTVFRLSRSSGSWKEQVLYSFDGQLAANPFSGVILDSEGRLYGTCANGNGVTTVGAVFELIQQSDDNWLEKNLYLFTRSDGEFPEAALLRDAIGNLYGTTLLGGLYNTGVVFKVSP